MRFRNLLIVVVALVVASCNGNHSVKISGSIAGGENTTVFLLKRDVTSSVVVDSSVIDASGKFKFKVDVESPSFYMLQLSKKSPVTLLLTPGEKLEFSANAETFDRAYTVAGSEGSVQVQDVYLRLIALKDHIDSLSSIAKNLSGNQSNLLGIYSEIDSLVLAHKEYSIEFMRKNINSIVPVFALYQQTADDVFLFGNMDDIVYYRMVASSLKAFYPNLIITKAVIADYEELNKKQKSYKVNQLIASVESSLPDIELPNINGDTVKLSSFKGKVIILDFWSAVAQNALLDNKELFDIYNEFKGKGLVVYQVSVDEDGRAWANAIRNAGINWTAVRDNNGPNGMAVRVYNVQKVPSNYIIGKNYDIVGKNLYGDKLRKKLKAILG